MKTSLLFLALLAASSAAFAGGHGRPGWGGWVEGARPGGPGGCGDCSGAAVVVPAGSATYNGATVATVVDRSSGTEVRSVATGAVRMDVAFSGTGTTTQSGSITGITALGDLAFTGTGTGNRFNGAVTSATYTEGTGNIRGSLSAPVVSGASVSAPLSAKGNWGFSASDTLSARGAFAAVR